MILVTNNSIQCNTRLNLKRQQTRCFTFPYKIGHTFFIPFYLVVELYIKTSCIFSSNQFWDSPFCYITFCLVTVLIQVKCTRLQFFGGIIWTFDQDHCVEKTTWNQPKISNRYHVSLHRSDLDANKNKYFLFEQWMILNLDLGFGCKGQNWISGQIIQNCQIILLNSVKQSICIYFIYLTYLFI